MVPETDRGLLAVRARFSRDWDLVDSLAYLIEHLQTNQLAMASRGLELGFLKLAPRIPNKYQRK